MNIKKIHCYLASSIGVIGLLSIILMSLPTSSEYSEYKWTLNSDFMQFSLLFLLFILYSVLAVYFVKKKYGSAIQKLLFGNLLFLLVPMALFLLYGVVAMSLFDDNERMFLPVVFGTIIFMPAVAIGLFVGVIRLVIQKHRQK